MISCECETDVTLHPRLAWTGLWPGEAECREFGWFAQFVEGKGWVPCDPDTPGAQPNLTRLYSTATWDPEKARWVV